MNRLLLLVLLLVGCESDPEIHFIYDVTQTGSAYLSAEYFEEGTDWEGYYWSESWYWKVFGPVKFSALNGKLQWTEEDNKLVYRRKNIYLINTIEFKPVYEHPSENLQEYKIRENYKYLLYVVGNDKGFLINRKQYEQILEAKRQHKPIWVTNHRYIGLTKDAK